MREACSITFPSNSQVSGLKKRIKFNEAKLHAVLSKNMYSEHGFDALILPPSGHVCHSLMEESYCTPGSAQAQAASPIISPNSFAGIDFITFPFARPIKSQFFSSSNALKNA